MHPKTLPEIENSSLAHLAKAIHKRAVHVSDVVDYYLNMIAASEPRLGAFAFLDEDACRTEARRQDLLINSTRQPGKLQGIPIAVKDIYAVDGMPMHLGSDAKVPVEYAGDGPFIKQLRRQGAVVIGKTAMTELSLGTVNLTRRQPWNPVDPNVHRTAGGSSGGSAVAVAAGFCKVALGTDTGGSVRQPAAMCGVVGYKSSYGTWDMASVFPLSKSFDSIGVFTRTIDDLEYFLDPILGSNGGPANCPNPELIFDLPQQMLEDLDDAVAAQFDILLQGLVDRGVKTTALDISELLPLDEYFSKLVPTEFISEVGYEWYRGNRVRLDPVSVARLDAAIGTSDTELSFLRKRLRSIQASVSALMQGGRFWLCPTTPSPALALDRITSVHEAAAWNKRTTRNTRPINVFNQCAISVPMKLPGFDLPIGVQLVGSHGSDRALLRAALALEGVIRSLGGAGGPELR